MTTSDQSQSTDPRVASYLDALNRALHGLPDLVHAEVYSEIRQHIADELAGRPGDPSAVPEVLDRLGDPIEIAREAGAYPSPRSLPQRKSRVHEIFAVILVSIGGFVAGIGWLVGIVLLWTSDRFTRADKVIGTILVPGGFLTSFVALAFGVAGPTTVETCVSSTQSAATTGGSTVSLAASQTCTGGHTWVYTAVVIAIALVVIFGPLYTTIRLSRRVAQM
jgi:uncharacterized membrane protein